MLKLPSFDQLKELAEKDPLQLEQLRQQLIDDTINSAPQSCQQRLRGLQFEVDAKRRVAKNPMSACITISRMMHDRLSDLRDCLVANQDTLHKAGDLLQQAQQQTQQQAQQQAQSQASQANPTQPDPAIQASAQEQLQARQQAQQQRPHNKVVHLPLGREQR